MTKVFEDYFSELQADMVSICLEYVNNKADKIFIYASNEFGQFTSDVFYKINNCVVEKHRLNSAVQNEDSQHIYNVSKERQVAVLNICNDNLRKIKDLCQENNREMPTEMKLIYDVPQNNLKAQYSYEIKYTNDPVKTAGHIFDEWFVEMGGKL
jgi:vacuolar-type H+-ATPase subunit F/Vma7